MTLYVDTSIWVSVLTPEPDVAELQWWLAGQPSLAVSWWSATEFASALAKKQRERSITGENRNFAEGAFRRLLASSLTILPVIAASFDRARQFVGDPLANLRSSDALHLAVAFDNGLQLATLDKRMASGGRTVGVATLLL